LPKFANRSGIAMAVEFDRFMSDSDGIMWTIERDPQLRSTIVVVLTLDRPPDWERLVANAEEATHDIPRLRQVVLATPLRLGPPRWANAVDFDVRNHVHHFGAPAPGDVAVVLDIAAYFAETKFPTGQPLWDLAVVDGLVGGRAAVILKLHHAMTDGVGGMRLLARLVDLSRDVPARPGTAPPAPSHVPPPVVAAEGAAHTAHQAVRTSAAAGRASARTVWRALREPLAVGRDALVLGRSLVRVLAPFTATLSPLMTERSSRRGIAVLEYPLADLSGAAHAVDATLNDVFVTAVANALGAYHAKLARPVEELRMTMPISTRTDGDPMGGNRLLPARFAVPVGDDVDLVARIHAIGARCRAWREEPALPMADGIATVLDHLPAMVTTRLFGSMLKHVDFLTTNVPGSAVPVYLAGAKVERFWALAPPMGSAVNVSLISYAGTACVGVNLDPYAVRDHALFLDCLAGSFDDVLALAPRPTEDVQP
jgi:WS/DGAT/MGAT family acyltransferase